ncbi:MAG: diguanylate cyclase [Candidatus Eiseniibacteriota bacterium]
MKQRDIGFRELLERVLPLEELPAADRSRVERALSSGAAAEIERAALSTIERLAEGGALRRVPSPRASGETVIRFQPRNALEIITLHMPGPPSEAMEGVIAYPRSALPARVLTRLEQLRRMLRLDDPTVVADAGAGQGRPGVMSQFAEAGRELLGDAALAYHAAARAAEDAAAAEPGEAAESGPGPLDPDLAGHALAHPAAIFYCPDAGRVARIAAAARARGVRSLVAVAVGSPDGARRGTLEVASPTPGAFVVDDLARIALLADYCGGLLDRAERIEKLVFVDPLTRVYNRSYFDLQAQNELARARRDKASVAMCIADIDNFKAFNTTFGFEAGNQVLTQVAQTLRGGVRPFDTVARWGGEEFAVLLAAPVSADAARAISERLRVAVERLRVRLEALDRTVHQVAVTVSIGVALSPEHAETPQDLWRAANQALLRAKAGRKNQVVFHTPPR